MLCPEADRPPTQEKYLHHRQTARAMSSTNQGQLLFFGTAFHLHICMFTSNTLYWAHIYTHLNTCMAVCRHIALLTWQGPLSDECCRGRGQVSAPAALFWQRGSIVRRRKLRLEILNLASECPLLLFYESLVTYLCTAARAAICYFNCVPVGHRCNRRPAAANVCSVIWRCCPACT